MNKKLLVKIEAAFADNVRQGAPRLRDGQAQTDVSCSLLARIDGGVIVTNMLSAGAFAWWAFPIGDLGRTSVSAPAMKIAGATHGDRAGATLPSPAASSRSCAASSRSGRRRNHSVPRAIESGLQASTRRVAFVKSSGMVPEIELREWSRQGEPWRREQGRGSAGRVCAWELSRKRDVARVDAATPCPIHEHQR